MEVTAAVSVQGFFQEVLSKAMEGRSVSASDQTIFYLTSLLGDFTKARLCDEPLGMKLASAPGGAERISTLKEVGDTSLYLSGFFADSLERKLVDVEYYVGLGTAAYGELASRLGSSSASEVYGELSAQFPRFVDVLNEVRGRINFVGDGDLLGLYEQWKHTKADWIEKRFQQLGLLTEPTDEKVQ